ncbi:cytidylyltransferase domain-containing protein [Vibrio aquimaris]|uniref:CMP-N,N'-diacetyllegionaminic acid synthase n=1 Tax=Vibrio aquimaris TaxID=2587862 RepID=A0A5P9CF95_9VIBR|nr:acylneuraminate cytidylyltransferase family protein [Vibrio aquimaris]QFT24856.1 CMP-N,N'-diacetyllegionaminic acid synthase [Vibrio aquimaris]
MIAIIPARGGSKGLPGKNTRLLCNKPLIAYTIESALKSSFITKVIVSTESSEIYDISVKYGASETSLRPKELATDTSLAIDTYKYTITKIEQDESIDIDSFVVLLPTAPLRTSDDIDLAIDLFHKKEADSVLSYTKESHPVYWHGFVEDSGKFSPLFESNNLSNRQDLRATYYPNGAIYVFKKDLIMSGKYTTDNTYAYLMPRERSVDIDTLEDFKYAEYLMGNYCEK